MALETPYLDVSFSLEREEADASLAWKESRVLLLSEASYSEFVEAFGYFDEINGWSLYRFSEFDAHELIDEIKR